MAFSDLTDEQKADFARYDVFLRGTFRQLSKMARDADIGTWNQFAKANIADTLALLADDDMIPNATGLGGAKDLTVAEFRQLQTIARQLSGMLETNRPLLVKAIGVNA